MHKIKIVPSAQRDFDRLENKFFEQIKDKINPLSQTPRPSQSLKLTAEEGYRIRSGDYRILYRIDDTNRIVYIYRIKHRKESYR